MRGGGEPMAAKLSVIRESLAKGLVFAGVVFGLEVRALNRFIRVTADMVFDRSDRRHERRARSKQPRVPRASKKRPMGALDRFFRHFNGSLADEPVE